VATIQGEAISFQILTDNGWQDLGEIGEVSIEPGQLEGDWIDWGNLEFVATIDEFWEVVELSDGRWLKVKHLTE